MAASSAADPYGSSTRPRAGVPTTRTRIPSALRSVSSSAVISSGTPVHGRRVYEDRVYSVSFFPLREGGEIVAVGTTALDVTESEAERALLDALFERAPIGIGFWDRDLRYRRLNQALAEMNGLPAEEHLGRTVGEVLPGLPGDVMQSMARVVREGRPVLGTVAQGETPARPGVVRTWQVSYYPVQDPQGTVTGVGAVCEEITEVVTHLAFYTGWPNAGSAALVVKQVFEERPA